MASLICYLYSAFLSFSLLFFSVPLTCTRSKKKSFTIWDHVRSEGPEISEVSQLTPTIVVVLVQINYTSV